MNGAHVLKPAPSAGAPAYWSFSGASYADRRDWVQPRQRGLRPAQLHGHERLRLRRRHAGRRCLAARLWPRRRPCRNGAEARLAAAHDDGRAARASRSNAISRSRLQPGESFSTFADFRCACIAAIISRTLDAYRRSWPSAGWRRPRCPRPPTSRSGAPGAMSATSPSTQVVEHAAEGERARARLGRCSTTAGRRAIGDWELDPAKFPRGDADMIAFVDAIKDAGHEAQAVDRAACGGSRQRPAARSSRHAAARQATARRRT